MENFESEVLQRLTTIEAKLSNGITKNQEDHEQRLRVLEKWFWKAMGALALLQVLGLAAIKLFLR